nr:hypothetical protein [Rhodoferax sp.]
MKQIRDAWASSTTPVRVALVVAVAALMGYGMYKGLDLGAMFALLSSGL